MNVPESAGSQQYRVSELSADDSRRWDEFVEGSVAGSFFHLSAWRTIIEDSLGHRCFYLLCEREGQVVGILPLAHVRSVLFGSSLVSLPFLVYGGVVSEDCRAEVLLVQAAEDLAHKLRVDYLELRNREQSNRDWPVRTIYSTFVKPLSVSSEENMKAIPRKQRAMVRKGIEAGLVAENDEGVDRLYDALSICKRDLGTPFFGKSVLNDIKRVFGDRAEITTITKDDRTICSVMSFKFRDEILPYYGGGGHLARQFKGNDFMYWAVMEKAVKDGFKVFDFGRSMVDTGPYRFKKHWGFEPAPLSYEYLPIAKNDMPNLNPANPKYGPLIKAWKRLPVSITRLIGPPLARRLA